MSNNTYLDRPFSEKMLGAIFFGNETYNTFVSDQTLNLWQNVQGLRHLEAIRSESVRTNNLLSLTTKTIHSVVGGINISNALLKNINETEREGFRDLADQIDKSSGMIISAFKQLTNHLVDQVKISTNLITAILGEFKESFEQLNRSSLTDALSTLIQGEPLSIAQSNNLNLIFSGNLFFIENINEPEAFVLLLMLKDSTGQAKSIKELAAKRVSEMGSINHCFSALTTGLPAAGKQLILQRLRNISHACYNSNNFNDEFEADFVRFLFGGLNNSEYERFNNMFLRKARDVLMEVRPLPNRPQLGKNIKYVYYRSRNEFCDGYYNPWRVVEPSDAYTLTCIDGDGDDIVAVDKHNLYRRYGPLRNAAAYIFDPNTFVFVHKAYHQDYYKDKNSVFKICADSVVQNIKEMDASSIKVKDIPSWDILQDQYNVFLESELLSGIDGPSAKIHYFERDIMPKSNEPSSLNPYGSNVIRKIIITDKNNCYSIEYLRDTWNLNDTRAKYVAAPISGIDKTTFKIHTHDILSDKNHVYHLGKNQQWNILKSVDSQSLEFCKTAYHKNGYIKYSWYTKMDGYVTTGFLQDKNNVYYECDGTWYILENADPCSINFNVLPHLNRLITDSCHVYVRNNSGHWQVLPQFNVGYLSIHSRDEHHVLFSDNKHVYYNEHVLIQTDQGNFERSSDLVKTDDDVGVYLSGDNIYFHDTKNQHIFLAKSFYVHICKKKKKKDGKYTIFELFTGHTESIISEYQIIGLNGRINKREWPLIKLF